MLKVKDIEPKEVVRKRNITVTNVSIEGGIFVDENGEIARLVKESLPEGVSQFDIKISVELPE